MSNILIVNIGSTSFKWKLYSMPDEVDLSHGQIENVGQSRSNMIFAIKTGYSDERIINTYNGYGSCINVMLDILINKEYNILKKLDDIDAIGFKTVHGGKYIDPVIIDENVLAEMEKMSVVVPAHNPPYISAIKRFKKKVPKIPLVAVFETCFHKSIPDYAYIYGIPYEFLRQYGIRRYGFHGASHRYVSEEACRFLSLNIEKCRIITCHLGGTSSISAIKNGKSIDNSLGFSCQSGLPMSNRCGDIDPFIFPYIMQVSNKHINEIGDILIRKSGLFGISGISKDIREIEESAKTGNYRAELALKTFAYSVKKYIGAYTAAMGGLDVLVFTGGIGQNDVRLRKEICFELDILGVHIDGIKNQKARGEAVISSYNSNIKILVIPTNEEVIVARETYKLTI